MKIEKVDRKLLLDILSTAIDESCRSGYWGQIQRYKWYWWYVQDDAGEPDTDRISPFVDDQTVLCRIRDDEDEAGRYRRWSDVTLEKLEQATLWAIDKYAHLFSSAEISRGEVIDLDYDATGADVILQKVVLGSVFYG